MSDRLKQTAADFPIGSKAILASGGPVMTVATHCPDGTVLCVWDRAGSLEKAAFLPPMLGKVAERQETDDAWLDDIVTDEAKKDPDWRAKARTGRGAITSALQAPGEVVQALPVSS